MADAVLLSQEMFDRIKKMLDDYEKGYADSIQLGKGLEVDERGTGYMKFSASNFLQSLSPTNTLNLNVCVNNASVEHTFVITK